MYAGKVPAKVAKYYGMISNIDDNFGRLLAKLEEWDIDRKTIVIFMTDNGGTAGVEIYNAGMKGKKGTPYQGGTRVPAFWRWPGVFNAGVDVNQLTAHIDIFPTLAELAGTKLSKEVRKQVEGRSLVPLLKNKNDKWADRILFTHVGRWEKGEASKSKYSLCSVRNTRYELVNATRGSENWELFDLQKDFGEKNNVINDHPDVAGKLKKALDKWWNETQPYLVNEDVIGPKENPFKELYRQQIGGILPKP